jgi:hypothetical protein
MAAVSQIPRGRGGRAVSGGEPSDEDFPPLSPEAEERIYGPDRSKEFTPYQQWRYSESKRQREEGDQRRTEREQARRDRDEDRQRRQASAGRRRGARQAAGGVASIGRSAGRGFAGLFTGEAGGTAAGTALGALAYCLGLQLVKGGPSQLRAWLAAKSLNRTPGEAPTSTATATTGSSTTAPASTGSPTGVTLD